jgi:amino-acid N-acetyltransferase
MSLQIGAGTAQDSAHIRALLAAAQLPTDDLDSIAPYCVVVRDEAERVVGTGALQWFGDVALLRSVAVAAEFRKAGLGRRIVAELEKTARAAGISQLVLLTTTARGFFESLGYRVIDRQTVPQGLHQSEEFRSLCPSSAVCMAKSIARE